MFLRLNTGSLKLSPQELRQALHPGEFIDFADDFSSNSSQILSIFNLKNPDSRMRDVEVIIRYFTFKYYLEKYDGNLKNSFDFTVKDLNSKWDDLEDKIVNDSNELNNSIDFIYQIFGKRQAFSKYVNGEFQNNFNRAVFDIMVYYFSIPNVREKSIDNSEKIIAEFKKLCENDLEFLSSFEHTTKSISNTSYRFNKWGNTLKDILDIEFKIPTLVNNRIKLK